LRIDTDERLHPVAAKREASDLAVVLKRECLCCSPSQELCQIRKGPLAERISAKLVDIVIPALELDADLDGVLAVEIAEIVTEHPGGVTNPPRSEIECLSGSSKSRQASRGCNRRRRRHYARGEVGLRV